MGFEYKINVLEALKSAGYSTYRIRQEHLISEKGMQQIREGSVASYAIISKICDLLGCDIGDILTHVKEDSGSSSPLSGE